MDGHILSGQFEPVDLKQKKAGPGVSSLLKGSKLTPTPGFPSRPKNKCAVPRWFLFSADLLLVSFALLILHKSQLPLTFSRMFISSSAIVLGAALGISAVLMEANE